MEQPGRDRLPSRLASCRRMVRAGVAAAVPGARIDPDRRVGRSGLAGQRMLKVVRAALGGSAS